MESASQTNEQKVVEAAAAGFVQKWKKEREQNEVELWRVGVSSFRPFLSRMRTAENAVTEAILWIIMYRLFSSLINCK